MQRMEVEQTDELTETEAELYDRQIRLWGLESQKRLRTAKVLICGLSGLGAEITKNILLSGINYVRLQDDAILTEQDFGAQFLAAREDLGKNRAEASVARAKKLNPAAVVAADTESLSAKEADYFRHFNVVVLIGVCNAEILRIDEICRDEHIKLFVGDQWGFFGYIFADLQQHIFMDNVVKHKVVSAAGEKIKTEMIITHEQKQLSFPAFSVLLNFNYNSAEYQRRIKRNGPGFLLVRILQQFRNAHKRDPSHKSRQADILELRRIRDDLALQAVLSDSYFELLFVQIAPASAVIGGVLAQEIIKVITQNEAPHRNVFIFDPISSCGVVEAIGV